MPTSTKKIIRRVRTVKSATPKEDKRHLSREMRERKEKARAKQMQALELRKSGLTYQEIAAALGYKDQSGAKKACDRAMENIVMDAAKEVITMDLQNLDDFQKRCIHALRQNGDLSQIDRLLRIQERRYALLGISDDTMKELREAHGVNPNITNNGGVMIIQTRTVSDETEFIKKMMQAVGQDPDSEEAQKYLEARVVKEIEGKKITRRTVKKKEDPNGQINENFVRLGEEEIVDAEIVGPTAEGSL